MKARKLPPPPPHVFPFNQINLRGFTGKRRLVLDKGTIYTLVTTILNGEQICRIAAFGPTADSGFKATIARKGLINMEDTAMRTSQSN